MECSGEVEEAERRVAIAFYEMVSLSDNLDRDAKNLISWVTDRAGGRPGFERCVKWIRDRRRIPSYDAFSFYACKTYATHPWHNHSQRIREITTNIDSIYTEVCTFCRESFLLRLSDPTKMYPLESPEWKHVHLKEDSTEAEAVDVIKKLATTLHNIAYQVRGIICLMQGTYYSKTWAVEIAMRYDNPIERGAAVREMIANKRIPVTSTRLLQDLITKKKRGVFFIDDEWKSVGGNQRKGYMMLALRPVKMWHRWNVHFADVKSSLYAPPKPICLHDYFGARTDVRLYFSPRQFPTPMNLLHGDCCTSFENLKTYVFEQSKRNGEVAFTGGTRGKSGRFSCKKKTCKFHFIVKWDKYGYYIHHYNYDTESYVGSVDHNH